MKKIKRTALVIVASLACIAFTAIGASAQNNNMNSNMSDDQMKSSPMMKKHRMMRRHRMRRRHRMMMRKRNMMMKKSDDQVMKKNP